MSQTWQAFCANGHPLIKGNFVGRSRRCATCNRERQAAFRERHGGWREVQKRLKPKVRQKIRKARMAPAKVDIAEAKLVSATTRPNEFRLSTFTLPAMTREERGQRSQGVGHRHGQRRKRNTDDFEEQG